jgi:predicted amidophosphoribosyltransferase
VRAVRPALGTGSDPLLARGELISARRCWYCSIDDVGLDTWVVAGDRLACGDCASALLGRGLPYVRVMALHRGRAGSPRRSLGEIYHALVAFKERHDGWEGLAAPLAHMLATSIRQVMTTAALPAAESRRGGPWVVAPVPSFQALRPHVRILTALAAAELPYEAAPTLDLLVKRVDFVQKGMSRADRWRASADAYVLRRRWGRSRSEVRGARVIVTDDFFTTGATLAECAWVVRSAGAAAVYGAAVVRVILAPGERLLPLRGRQARVQLREVDARGRAPIAAGDGVLWLRFACVLPCAAVHTAGPIPVPGLDRLAVHRWLCQCGVAHVIRLRREWLGGTKECVAVMLGTRRPAEILVGVAQEGTTFA